MVGDVAQP